MHVPRLIAITFIGRNVRNVRDSNRHFAPFDNPLQLLDMKVKFFAQIKVACARAAAIKEIRHGLRNHVEFILRHLLLACLGKSSNSNSSQTWEAVGCLSKGRLLCNRVDMDLVPARERKGKSARPCSNVAGPPELLGNEIASQVYKEGAS